MAASAWETRDYSHLLGVGAHDHGAGDLDEGMSQAECSQVFMNMLVEMKMQGMISAKNACILSYWAKRGGLVPPGDALALPPTRTGGAFSEKIDRVIGLDSLMKQDWYRLPVPGHCKHEACRTSFSLAVKPAYEAIAQELAETTDWDTKLETSLLAGEWAPSFSNHPLVTLHGRRNVIPLGIYVDGVQYGHRDSTTGFWCINLLTGRRHLLAAFPKRDFCRCGVARNI